MKTLCHRRPTLNKTNDSTSNSREIEDPSFDPRHTSDRVFGPELYTPSLEKASGKSWFSIREDVLSSSYYSVSEGREQ